MDPIANSVANSTANVQQAVQISMIKKGQDNDAAMAAKILASVAPAPAQRPSPPGVGTLVDVRA
jgi:Putative motility protein